MTSIETACLLAGAVLLTTGVAFMFWPAGLVVAGLLLLAAGLDVGLGHPEKRG